MIVGVVVVTAFFAAAAPALPVLRGIDSLPSPAAVAATSTSALSSVALDASAPPLQRARALRLLGVRGDVDDAVFVALRQSPVAELRVQAAFAQADRARLRGGVVAFATALLRDPEPALRGVAVTVLARDATPAARTVLAAHHDVDPRLQSQVRAKLRRLPR